MHSCIIIDDEISSISSLKEYIKNMHELTLIESYTNPLVALEEVRKGTKPDIVFLDVDMPELSGIEVAELLPKGIAIIFTTAHSKFALQAFQLDALDFLLKPYSYSMFFKSVMKVFEKIEKPTKKDEIQSIFINPGTKGEMVQLSLAKILYIEALDHSVCINLMAERFVTKVKLTEILSKLPKSKFARVHRSFIINLDMIQSIHANQIILKNNSKVPIGEVYKKPMLERIQHKTISSN